MSANNTGVFLETLMNKRSIRFEGRCSYPNLNMNLKKKNGQEPQERLTSVFNHLPREGLEVRSGYDVRLVELLLTPEDNITKVERCDEPLKLVNP